MMLLQIDYNLLAEALNESNGGNELYLLIGIAALFGLFSLVIKYILKNFTKDQEELSLHIADLRKEQTNHYEKISNNVTGSKALMVEAVTANSLMLATFSKQLLGHHLTASGMNEAVGKDAVKAKEFFRQTKNDTEETVRLLERIENAIKNA